MSGLRRSRRIQEISSTNHVMPRRSRRLHCRMSSSFTDRSGPPRQRRRLTSASDDSDDSDVNEPANVSSGNVTMTSGNINDSGIAPVTAPVTVEPSRSTDTLEDNTANVDDVNASINLTRYNRRRRRRVQSSTDSLASPEAADLDESQRLDLKYVTLGAAFDAALDGTGRADMANVDRVAHLIVDASALRRRVTALEQEKATAAHNTAALQADKAALEAEKAALEAGKAALEHASATAREEADRRIGTLELEKQLLEDRIPTLRAALYREFSERMAALFGGGGGADTDGRADTA